MWILFILRFIPPQQQTPHVCASRFFSPSNFFLSRIIFLLLSLLFVLCTIYKSSVQKDRHGDGRKKVGINLYCYDYVKLQGDCL